MNDISRGVVITVVRIAISTSMLNTLGGITPSSNPTLMTTSPMSPRVFINVPTQRDSRDVYPLKYAAAEHPPHFPAIATAETSAAKSHSCPDSSDPMFVRSPV